MRASEFEFRHRFWLIGVLFALAFFCYRIDPLNMAVWLATLGHVGSANPSAARLRWVFGVGTLVALTGVAIRSWGTAYLSVDVMTDAPVRTDRVVADGPYRYTRNPLYFGNLLFAAGIGLMASRLGWLILTAGMLIFGLRLIGLEEARLNEEQGEAYRIYRAAVPRFFPALRARLPRGELRPRWGQALAGEAFMWVFVVAMATLTATLEVQLSLWIMLAGFVIGMLIMRLWPRGGDRQRQT